MSKSYEGKSTLAEPQFPFKDVPKLWSIYIGVFSEADMKRTVALEADLIVLDDWGLTALDPGARVDLMEIIDDRAAIRATPVTIIGNGGHHRGTPVTLPEPAVMIVGIRTHTSLVSKNTNRMINVAQ